MNPRYLLMTDGEVTDTTVGILFGLINRLETERARQYDIIAVAGVQNRWRNNDDGYWTRQTEKATAQIALITSAIVFMEQALAHVKAHRLDRDQHHFLRLACRDVANAAQQLRTHYAPANWRELVGWPDDKQNESEE